ncbi:hypothetical protein MAP00_002933 [Monascus purpureus]|nr:hypothetical protein MAP00_002933 [Monascus purpureus]
MGNETQSPGTMLDSSSPGRDVVEYHNDVHFMSILGEIMGHRRTKRMIRIVIEENPTAPDEVCDQRLPPNVKRELSGLDETDVDYICSRRARSGSRRRSAGVFVVYPYAPVLNRVKFMQSYQSSQHSSLLLNSILVSAVPYAPTALLKECGFEDRSSAQKHFFSTAVLLYDFGCGKNQIHRLQSSLLLGTVIFSFVSEKDFRYWLHNAVRIATRMGLHRINDLDNHFDPATYKLCRRIWWVIYCRNVLLSISGMENIQMIHSCDCNTAPMTEDDWEEADESPPNLPPITPRQKLFWVEYSKLAIIGARCLAILKSQQAPLSSTDVDVIVTSFNTWRVLLPDTLRTDKRLLQTTNDDIWPIVLVTTCYRFECAIYRRVCRMYQTRKEIYEYDWAKQQLRKAVFDFDMIIGKVMAYDMLSRLPLSFIGCVYTVIALHIETTLDPTESPINQSLALPYIHQGILALRAISEQWRTAKWTLQLFEWVLTQKNIPLPPHHPGAAPGSPRSQEREAGSGADARFSQPDLLAHGHGPYGIESDTFTDEFMGFDFLSNPDLLGLWN